MSCFCGRALKTQPGINVGIQIHFWFWSFYPFFLFLFLPERFFLYIYIIILTTSVHFCSSKFPEGRLSLSCAFWQPWLPWIVMFLLSSFQHWAVRIPCYSATFIPPPSPPLFKRSCCFWTEWMKTSTWLAGHRTGTDPTPAITAVWAYRRDLLAPSTVPDWSTQRHHGLPSSATITWGCFFIYIYIIFFFSEDLFPYLPIVSFYT